MNRFILLILFFSFTCCARKKVIDQKSESQSLSGESTQSNTETLLWKELLPDQYKRIVPREIKMPKKFRVFSLDSLAMQNLLAKSVKQNQWLKGNHNLIIEFPSPDSGFSTFSIYETSVMDSALAAHYPNMKTYAGQGTAEPSESVRFDFNENGFNAYITGQKGEWFIQPLKQGITHQYLLSFYKKDITDFRTIPFELPDSLRHR